MTQLSNRAYFPALEHMSQQQKVVASRRPITTKRLQPRCSKIIRYMVLPMHKQNQQPKRACGPTKSKTAFRREFDIFFALQWIPDTIGQSSQGDNQIHGGVGGDW